MQIRAAHLCDFASIREGLLTIVSAGITRSYRAEVGAPLAIFLAMVVEVSPTERLVPHEVHVRVDGPNGVVGDIRGGFQVTGGTWEEDEPGLANMAFDLRMFPAPAFGWYTATIEIDGAELTSVRVKIVEGARPDVIPPVVPPRLRHN